MPIDAHGLQRARLSLEGLSLGDAFGERFFVPDAVALGMVAERRLPPAPWRWTDDTAMALAVVHVLEQHGQIDQDALAQAFVEGYQRDPTRGYGRGAHEVLGAIASGVPWETAARALFGGQGSMGNGAAMRAAPVGAYFAREWLEQINEQAVASAKVTHAHPDGVAGADAVTVAAALAWRRSAGPDPALTGQRILETVADALLDGPVRDGVLAARDLPFTTSPREAARLLGSGYKVLASDTVPFALWCAARHLDDFEAALWAAAAGLGDVDTTCAIVGGIVALSAPALPAEWLSRREPLVWPIPRS